ncbi:MAG: tRNA pseudouridine(54/55) synthase Pus10 [Candidatus Micrarchaeota archaeon]|nr:tRNA pseudouridine(54/55) synthase Pus10 [Candidatus Micrarchaeota archaeon]
MNSELIDNAIAMLSNESVKSFSLSTKIDDSQLTEEEKEFDVKFTGAKSIKATMNHEISSKLSKSTGKKYDSGQGEVRVIVDFLKNEVYLEHDPIFIFGRYKKLEGGISQSRWQCRKCDGDGCFKCDYSGKNYESVEEAIAEPFKEATNSREYSLHASGREDVDAMNLAGRPFVVEIIEPKTRVINLIEMAKKINEKQKVVVEDLQFVTRPKLELVTESHFDKEYEAEIEFSKEFNEEDAKKINSLVGVTLIQQTPTRVVHRRADLDRKRKIILINCVSFKGNTAKVRVLAEAGTYIKELISGDKGRTKPSIAELLSCNAKCKQLTVTRIDDEYLKMLGL